MTDLDFENLGKRFGLPVWFLERVVIEYLDCRVFSKILDIDFSKVDVLQLEDLLSHQPVVVLGSAVIENLHPDTYRSRIMSSLAGRPTVPLTAQTELLEPEGKITEHGFPSIDNSYEAWDPKLGFYSHFQVFDEGQLWQWRISEFSNVENRNYGRWVSDEIDLSSLDEVTPRFRALDATRTDGPGRPSVGEVREFFDWIESIRNPIRNELRSRHLSKKAALKRTGKETSLPPPVLSAFESFALRGGKLYTRFHAEPIFFRALVRHCRSATELLATDGRFLDDIYSERIGAVINAAACLEAFVNSIGEKKFSSWRALHEKNSPTEKWRICLLRAGCEGVYDAANEPYQSFERLVRLRNNFMHHKPEDIPVTQGGTGPMTNIQKNMPASFIETLPYKVKELIMILCEKVGEPVPAWLDPKPGWDV